MCPCATRAGRIPVKKPSVLAQAQCHAGEVDSGSLLRFELDDIDGEAPADFVSDNQLARAVECHRGEEDVLDVALEVGFALAVWAALAMFLRLVTENFSVPLPSRLARMSATVFPAS